MYGDLSEARRCELMVYDAVRVTRGMVRSSIRSVMSNKGRSSVDVVRSCEIFVFRGQGRMLRITVIIGSSCLRNKGMLGIHQGNVGVQAGFGGGGVRV